MLSLLWRRLINTSRRNCTVECWFCCHKQIITYDDNLYHHMLLSAFTCNECLQFNGFSDTTATGYSRPVPGQHDLPLDTAPLAYVKRSSNATSYNQSSVLCSQCIRSQETKTRLIHAWEPDDGDWDHCDAMLVAYTRSVEKRYPLCYTCEAAVNTYLRDQTEDLRAQWVGERLRCSDRLTVEPVAIGMPRLVLARIAAVLAGCVCLMAAFIDVTVILMNGEWEQRTLVPFVVLSGMYASVCGVLLSRLEHQRNSSIYSSKLYELKLWTGWLVVEGAYLFIDTRPTFINILGLVFSMITFKAWVTATYVHMRPRKEALGKERRRNLNIGISPLSTTVSASSTTASTPLANPSNAPESSLPSTPPIAEKPIEVDLPLLDSMRLSCVPRLPEGKNVFSSEDLTSALQKSSTVPPPFTSRSNDEERKNLLRPSRLMQGSIFSTQEKITDCATTTTNKTTTLRRPRFRGVNQEIGVEERFADVSIGRKPLEPSYSLSRFIRSPWVLLTILNFTFLVVFAALIFFRNDRTSRIVSYILK